MSLLGETTVTRRRYTGGAWTAGRWVVGASADTALLASVQPLSGRDRQSLPEGDRSRDGRKLYTESRGLLRTDDQYGTLPADDVLIDGLTFRVVHVDTSHPLLAHDRVYVTRSQETSAVAETGIEVDIADAARGWLVGLGADGGIPNADRAVIIAHENGPRPPLPYVVVSVESFDERIGYDEIQVGSTGLTAPRGQRTGTLAFEGYGRGAEVWLERAMFLHGTDASLALLASLHIEPLGPLVDLSGLVDTDQERRVRREFAFTYVRTPDTDDRTQGVVLDQVQHTDTHDDGDGIDDLVITSTEDLTP